MEEGKEVNGATALFNNMMNRISKDGLRVIALCENSEGRMIMLGLMEYMNNQSTSILKQINLEKEAKLVAIEGGTEDIPEGMLSKMSPVSELLDGENIK